MINIANGWEINDYSGEEFPYTDRYKYLNQMVQKELENFRLLTNSLNGEDVIY